MSAVQREMSAEFQKQSWEDSPYSKHPKSRRRKDSKWEILTSLEPGTTYNIQPRRVEGYLNKRRKWPMKGWHKRYFVLERGVLTYCKTAEDHRRGRLIARINVGTSVVSAKTELFRIDIDDEDCIHHIKASGIEEFGLWLEQLQQHRFFQQNVLNNSGTLHNRIADDMCNPSKGAKGLSNGSPNRSIVQEFCQLDDMMTQQLLALQEKSIGFSLLAQRIEDDQNNFLSQQGSSSTSGKQKHFFGLRKKKSLSTATSGGSTVTSRSSTLTSMSSQTDGFGSAQKAQAEPQQSDMDLLTIGSNLATVSGLSNSNPSLSSGLGSSNSRPNSIPGSECSLKHQNSTKHPSPGLLNQYSSNEATCYYEDLLIAAQDLQSDVSNLIRSYSADRDKFKASLQDSQEFMTYMMGHTTLPGRSATMGSNTIGHVANSGNFGLGTLGPSGPSSLMVANLKHMLTIALKQNSLMRSKLQKISAEADISDLQMTPMVADTLPRGINQSLSYSSSCMSTSQFFDAREYNSDFDGTDETSEEEGDVEDDEVHGKASSDDEDEFKETSSVVGLDMGVERTNTSSSAYDSPGDSGLDGPTWNTGRRVKLPAIESDSSGINLWNLLCKNIGKDLSKISMPVTLNEPLSVLQRLCEELEYSDLLDKASTSPNLVDRMALISAFVVSSYSSCNARAGHKPFNPLLGETYECIRDDRGFRFISEQVSHHPPVSVCHAEGKSWSWWQEFRVKTKFWGKSMEFQPEGFVCAQLRLPDGSRETYRWTKITTCIHNLFNTSDRWADLYGQCVIECFVTSDVNNGSEPGKSAITCNLEFIKSASGYWSNGKRHEVQGTIIDSATSKPLQSLFGKCTEALYVGKAHSSRCIWRPAALPDDSTLFYGFSRFAIELNEILNSEKKFLPKTDTRFRPDQRYLEEGFITEAENAKLKLEQTQRERRSDMASRGIQHEAKWFSRTDDSFCQDQSWTFKNTYWDARQSQSFVKFDLPQLW